MITIKSNRAWWPPVASTRNVRRWQLNMLAINGVFMSLGAMFSYPYKTPDTRWLWGYGVIVRDDDVS